MRILILANAGIVLYKFRKELIEQLCKEHEVYIAFPKDEFVDQLQQLSCKYIPFNFHRRSINPIADLYQIKKYISLLRKIKPRIVLTYTIKPNVYGGIACQITRVPYITNITGLGTAVENGGILSFISKFLYKIGLRKARCTFFQNQSNQKLFVEQKILKGKARLLPGSGVNLEEYRVILYPDDTEGIRFLFAGRIMKEKGIDELLEAFCQVHQEYKRISLDIIGWNEEDYFDTLKKAEQEGVVHYHGFQLDVTPFYARCHCVILPSYYEGTPNVILEASSTGRPVITTRIPGCQETFDEGVTGFGCDIRNTLSLIEAMRKFLSLSQKEREEMGLAARAKMVREYDRNIVLTAYKEEIEAAIYESGEAK